MSETTLTTGKKPTLLDEFKEIPMLFRVLAILPIPFGVLSGGAIGAALGVLGSWSIVKIAKQSWGTGLKVGAVIGVYFALGLITMVISLIVAAVLLGSGAMS